MNGLIFTNKNCISCNKCVRVCTSPGASYVHTEEDSYIVHINANRCISCGACFAMCEHDARDYRDDTEQFFSDLKKGVPITLLLAPSFLATYPDEYGSILGGLKELGVRRIVSVAFGADICTWAYLKYIRENHFYGGISTPCPVAVSYIEHCLPELIPHMIPIHSPMVCAAIYCREELGITDRFAFIGPCIGKKMETDSFSDSSPVHYNLTFLKLMKYVRTHNVFGPDIRDEIEYGLGSFYPAPGGLAENIRWFLGDDALIRVVSGKTYLYGWLNKNAKDLEEGNTPFLIIEALNCQEGCIEGTGNEIERFEEDRMLGSIQKIKNRSKRSTPDSPWNSRLFPEERYALLNKQFESLQLSHYMRHFADRSGESVMLLPSDDEAESIFNEMLKFTEESRSINCSACGYKSCRDMMTAIYNGFNTKYNCIHFEMNKAKNAATEAEQANNAKSRFLSRMSHEIRTPINAIIGLNIIALRDKSISPRIRDELNKIGSSANHLLSLVNDILDMNRIESGRITLNEETFAFRDFLDQICVIIGGQCDDKGLRFVCSTMVPLDGTFVGDSLKLKQVIINILGNAVKFTDPPGTITLLVEQVEMSDAGQLSSEKPPRGDEESGLAAGQASDEESGLAAGRVSDEESSGLAAGRVSDEESGLAAKQASDKQVLSVAEGSNKVALRFTIKDTGIGMDEKYLPSIFDAFSQEDTANTSRYGGSGLGMAITKSFVEMMGGDIRVESEKGVGSIFTVTVLLGCAFDAKKDGSKVGGRKDGEHLTNSAPEVVYTNDADITGDGSGDTDRAVYNKDEANGADGVVNSNGRADDNTDKDFGEADDKTAESGSDILAGRHVLIVEDQEINAEVLADLLDLEGITSEWAKNGQLAVEMFSDNEQGHFDAILMDIRMPVMDGFAATREIRKLKRPDAASIPIIALTANAFEEDVRQCLETGMNMHQAKPVDLDLLLENLRQLIYH